MTKNGKRWSDFREKTLEVRGNGTFTKRTAWGEDQAFNQVRAPQAKDRSKSPSVKKKGDKKGKGYADLPNKSRKMAMMGGTTEIIKNAIKKKRCEKPVKGCLMKRYRTSMGISQTRGRGTSKMPISRKREGGGPKPNQGCKRRLTP